MSDHTIHFRSGRMFQMWAYSPSHSLLLLRSPKAQQESTNEDLLFVGTNYIQIGSGYTGLSVEDATPDELARVSGMVHEGAKVHKLFALVSPCSGRGLIAAVKFMHYANSLNMFEIDIEGFGNVRYRARTP